MEAKKRSSKKIRPVGTILNSPTTQPAQELRFTLLKPDWEKIGAHSLLLLQGSLLAGVAIFWIHLLIVTWGTAGLSMAAIGCGLILTSLFSQTALKNIPVEIPVIFLLAVTATSTWWWAKWDHIISTLLAWNSSLGFGFAVLLNAILLSVIIVAVLQYANSTFVCGDVNKTISPALLLGAVFGLWGFTWSLNAIFPVYQTATFSSLVLVLLCASRHTSLKRFFVNRKSAPQKSAGLTNLSPVSDLLLSFCAGWLVPGLYRMMYQLQPETTMLFYGAIAAILLGYVAVSVRQRNISGFYLAAWFSLVLLAFPLWVQLYLATSALVSSTLLAILLRQIGILAFFLPIGLLLGRAWLGSQSSHKTKVASHKTKVASHKTKVVARKESSIFRVAFSSVFIVGFYLSTIIVLQVGLPLLMALGIVGLAVSSIFLENFEAIKTIFSRTTSSKKRVEYCSLACCCMASFGLQIFYQPANATHALFSSHAFNAWRNGTSMKNLAGIDDGRLLEIQETSRGTLSLWRHQGEHIHLCRNGIPAGRISENDELSPQPTGELLCSVLPLAIHPTPRDILLLGMQSGLSLQTTLGFPVMNVTCVEADSGLIEQAKTGILASALQHVFKDDRVQIKNKNPAIAIRTLKQKYDVIIDSPGHSAVYSNSQGYDVLHYQHISKLLGEHGIYCQRFAYIDYGPTALASLSKTLRETFGYVTTFDTAPGEMLFIAAGSQEDVFSEELITRFSSPQVRATLAKIGWDWSVAMNLGRFDIDQIDSLKKSPINSVWNGTGSFGLSVEMMRWGGKWNEVRHALAQHSHRLLDHYQEDKKVDAILRRLGDVRSRRELLKNYPDQFWVYRKTLQTQLVDKPRSVILPVKGEGLQRKLHPEDKRRLKYFEALGKVNKKENCTPADIEKVQDFAYPYDPIISYFLHPELAKLHQRCETKDANAELYHLLHAIQFSGAQERSVRSIHRALTLLSEADISMSQAKRFDHINTLLEVLKQRWMIRKTEQGIAQSVLLIDLNNSLKLSAAGIEKMQQYANNSGIEKQMVLIREKELQRSLTRMLRSYRAEMLARNTRPRHVIPDTNTQLNK